MAPAEAEELGRFRANLEDLTLAELVALMLISLDELIDLARKLPGETGGLEIAAALSAELHRREQQKQGVHAGRLGHS